MAKISEKQDLEKQGNLKQFSEKQIQKNKDKFNALVGLPELWGNAEYKELVKNIVDIGVYEYFGDWREGYVILKDGQKLNFMSYKFAPYEEKFSENLPEYKKYLIVSPNMINTEKAKGNVWSIWDSGSKIFIFEKRNKNQKMLSVVSTENNYKETNYYTTKHKWFGKDWAIKWPNTGFASHKTVIMANILDKENFTKNQAYFFDNDIQQENFCTNQIDYLETNDEHNNYHLITSLVFCDKEKINLAEVYYAMEPNLTLDQFGVEGKKNFKEQTF